MISAALWLGLVFYLGLPTTDDMSNIATAHPIPETTYLEKVFVNSPHIEYMFNNGDNTTDSMSSIEKSCAPFACYTGEQFVQLYHDFETQGVTLAGSE